MSTDQPLSFRHSPLGFRWSCGRSDGLGHASYHIPHHTLQWLWGLPRADQDLPPGIFLPVDITRSTCCAVSVIAAVGATAAVSMVAAVVAFASPLAVAVVAAATEHVGGWARPTGPCCIVHITLVHVKKQQASENL